VLGGQGEAVEQGAALGERLRRRERLACQTRSKAT
jgi:hypothetical protein